jgi:hypothetical protein
VIGQHEVERAKIATLSDLIVIAHRVHEEDVSGINARLIDIESKPMARRKQRRRSGDDWTFNHWFFGQRCLRESEAASESEYRDGQCEHL